MKKTLVSLTVGLVVMAGLPLVVAAAVVPAVLNSGSLLGVGSIEASTGAAADGRIPPVMRALYGQAAATCPGLPWSVLAAIGTVESDNGQSRLPGVRTGQYEAGAAGPMQFEPTTFAEYDYPVPPGGTAPPNPYDAADAVYAAARMLCADGGGAASRLGQAVFDYNHSGAYVDEVLEVARSYGYDSADLSGPPAIAAAGQPRPSGRPLPP